MIAVTARLGGHHLKGLHVRLGSGCFMDGTNRKVPQLGKHFQPFVIVKVLPVESMVAIVFIETVYRRIVSRQTQKAAHPLRRLEGLPTRLCCYSVAI